MIMKGKNRWAALAAVIMAGNVWYSGCAMVETCDAEEVQALTEQLGYLDVLKRLDEAVDKAGVGDAQAARISGFPSYRINHFLASFFGELSDNEARKEWLMRLSRLGNEARRVELTNLPKEFFPDLPAELTWKDLVVETEKYAARMMVEDLSDPKRIKLLQDNADFPDEYNSWVRAIGLNPISKWFYMKEFLAVQNEARQDFQRPEAMSEGKIQWYVPDRPRPALSHKNLATILEKARNKSSLGIPEPDPESLIKLFDYYAPVWRISTIDDSDRIGRPFWQDDSHVGIDTADAVAYRYHSFTRIDDQVLLQLNYLIWFPQRPSQGWFDVLSGHIDGLIWRVTLDGAGRVMLYDSVHPCGCFHKYYPVSPHLLPLDEPPMPEPPLILTQGIPTSEKGRVVIHLKSREHYVVGLSTEAEQIEEAVSYRFDEYATLLNLPYGEGHRSLFNPEGVVIGTERSERWLVFPTTGVRYAGAMRQEGKRAVALIGLQHFDDARLFETAFRFKE
jgi:hypothetical protein